MNPATAETLKLLDAIKGQQRTEKAYTTSLGLNWFDLQPAALLLFPNVTPLRNMIPRVQGDGGTATNWKSLTGINTTAVSPGVSEGNRGAVITVTEQDNVAPYRGLGLEDYETWEAEYGSENFDNLRALMANTLLISTMIQEEKTIVGGNGSDGLALGIPATPVLAQSATGGALSNSTQKVYVVALTLDGYQRATVAGGVVTTISRTNADASSDTISAGSSNKSAQATITLTGGTATQSITATVTALKGAVAYAWFWGLNGSELLGAITTVNKVVITDVAAGTQNASAVTADNSKNALVFSGLIAQALKSGATGYYVSLDGAGFTSDNAGGIVELETMLKDRWDNYRVSPDALLMNSQELQNLSKKLPQGPGSTSNLRFNVQNPGNAAQNGIVGGIYIASYINKYVLGGKPEIQIMLHPEVPPGTIIVYSQTPPYTYSRIKQVIQIKTRKEYYQIEWPLRSRKYEAGVYVDELLQSYASFMFGVISNIGNS